MKHDQIESTTARNHRNDYFCLQWSLTQGLGSRSFGQYLQKKPTFCHDMFALWLEKHNSRLFSKWLQAASKIELTLEKCKQEKIHLLEFSNSNYPSLLKTIYDPPPVLYVRGSLECLQQNAVSIVGTRKPTAQGTRSAHEIATELANKGWVICSGLALGIDGIAHQATLSTSAPSIAILGTGVNILYPKQHIKLADSILENGGALVSEVPLSTPPNSANFPPRNRIISGISLATVVIEAAVKSGTLITATQALEQGREVFALPGSTLSPVSAGCHKIIQQGAHLLTCANDILRVIDLEHATQQASATQFDETSDALLSLMGFDVWSFEQLLELNNYDFPSTQSKLLEWELTGVVESIGGNQWQRVSG